MSYTCVLCDGTRGEPKPNGSEDWYWFASKDEHAIRVGPFCSRACAHDYKEKDPYGRIVVQFGAQIAEKLHDLQYRVLEQQEEGVYRLRWDRDPVCPFPEKLEKDESDWDLGPIRGVAPYYDVSSKLTLEEGDPAECWIEVEWEMA